MCCPWEEEGWTGGHPPAHHIGSREHDGDTHQGTGVCPDPTAADQGTNYTVVCRLSVWDIHGADIDNTGRQFVTWMKSEMLVEKIDTRWGCHVCQRLWTSLELSNQLWQIYCTRTVQCCDDKWAMNISISPLWSRDALTWSCCSRQREDM